jgi:hypothetical protein
VLSLITGTGHNSPRAVACAKALDEENVDEIGQSLIELMNVLLEI